MTGIRQDDDTMRTTSMSLGSRVRRAVTGEVARVAAAIAAIAAVATFPLVPQATSALPGDLGDPLLVAFILGWDASRMPAGFSGVWSAPFYFPLKDTLALSEHMLGIALFTAPVVWMTGNPVLANNVAFLASYVLAGVGMFLLARSLWGRRDAAFIAALAFAFAPHRVMHVPHLQLLMSGWMPLGLWGLHGYFATGSRRSLAVFAGAFAILGLSNGYFLYFFSLPVAVVVLCSLARAAMGDGPSRRFRMPWRQMAELALAASAVLAAIAPAALAYLRVRRTFGLRRALSEMSAYGAAWSDYVRIPDGLRLWSGILRVGAGERMLFPGLAIVALAALAVLTARRSAWSRSGPRPEGWAWHVGIYAAILVLAVWLSAGPSASWPYRLLLHVVPGFDGLRVPARLIVVVALALGVLGGAGAAWLFRRLRPRVATAAAIVLGTAIVLEGYGGPLAMPPFRHDQPVRAQLNEWMRSGPPGGVLELPIAGPDLEPFTLVYQYNTLLHGHPIVNGYSGYGYGLQDFLGGPGSPLGDPEALPGLIEGLREIGVRYVVLHLSAYSDRPELGWPDPKALVDLIDHAVGSRGRPFNDAVAWRLDAPRGRLPVDETALSPVPIAGQTVVTASMMPDRLRFAFDGNIDTKWHSAAPQAGSEWIRLEFGREVDVRRVVVLTSRGGVGDYPRGWAIESETSDNSRFTLFSGSFLPMLVRGLASGMAGAPAVFDLPSNRSRALWIRQTGRSATWQWAVHELEIYERRFPG
jgi:hypothetical protein